MHHQKFTLPDNHPLPSKFDIVECQRCGFVYADTHGSTADYDQYYSNYSKYTDTCSSGGGGDLYDNKRYATVAEAITGVLSNRSAKIVDIGCANGGMLQALKSQSFSNLLGVDPSIDCVNNTRALFSIDAAQGWLMQLPPSAASADLAIISHVFEHILDLHTAIRSVRTIVSPGGYVYAEVPDAGRYAQYMAAPFQDFNTEHINHFGEASLLNLFSSAGFSPVQVSAKIFETAAGVNYPAVFGFFRMDASPQRNHDWRRDEKFSANMGDYINKSRALIDKIDARLESLTGQEVIVWGVGQLTSKLLAETSLAKARIVSFVDSNRVYHGKRLKGIPISGADEIRSMPAIPIVIGSLLHHGVIKRHIEENLGLKNPIITLENCR
jgi:SAM-dependent methyltransferase